MVEVFKTNVHDRYQASVLIDQIHRNFENYQANFDLDDCDRILRVQCQEGYIESDLLINLLKNFGFHGEILPDDIRYSISTRSVLVSSALCEAILLS